MLTKRQASSTSPLDDASLLFQILSYVGPGQHIFVSTVCKLWHESYAAVPDLEVTSLVVHPSKGSVGKVLCISQMTLSSSIFASAARTRLAHQRLILTPESWKWQRIAGRVADVATLQVALELGFFGEDMMKGAAYAGCVTKLNFLEAFMRSSEQPLPDDICAYAASSGSVEALVWLEKRDLLHTNIALFQAAKFGHVDVLDYIFSEYCEIHMDDDLLPEAAKNGHSGAVECLFEHGAPYDAETICGDAAESGDLQLVQFVERKGGEINEGTMHDAAWRGHLALCQQLYSEQCPWHTETVAAAGCAGHTELVKWLVEQGCPYNAADVCQEAAGNGHLAVMQYILQLSPLSPQELILPLNAAAAYENLDVAQWLLQQGAEWPGALKYGAGPWSAEAVAWARQEGCTALLQ